MRVELLLQASYLNLLIFDVLDETADLGLRGLAVLLVLGLSIGLA